jgi:hypothetical protein
MKMPRTLLWTLSVPLALAMATASNGSPLREIPRPTQQQGQMEAETEIQQQTETVLEQWEEAPREKAQELIERYGQPDEVTSNRLIWHDGDWWKRTEVVNEEIPHNFPEEHRDFLYQTVDYNVPEDKVSDVIALSGSLIIDRVKGELTSRCDSEEHNLLALNLAHQIVQGDHTAQSARDVLAQARLEGQHADLTERLTFSPEELDEPADPGVVYGARPEDEEDEEEQPQE